MPQQDNDRFFEGQEVKAIFFSGAEESFFRVGHPPCKKITVVMEYGQMAGVPWFAVWDDHKIISKWNGAMLEGVEL